MTVEAATGAGAVNVGAVNTGAINRVLRSVTSALAFCAHDPLGSRASSLRAIVARKSVAVSSRSACSGRTVKRPLSAATKQSSKACATRTAGSSPTIRAAPLSEWAARIIDSIVSGDRWSSSMARMPAERIAVWLSASSRNSSSIENPLRSSATIVLLRAMVSAELDFRYASA